MSGYGDALDAVGGAASAILIGVFAIEQYGGRSGLTEDNAVQASTEPRPSPPS